MTFETIIAVGQALAAPALGAVAYYLRGLRESVRGVEQRATGIERQLTAMNGRLLKLEEWRTLHERMGERRDSQIDSELSEIREDVRHARFGQPRTN